MLCLPANLRVAVLLLAVVLSLVAGPRDPGPRPLREDATAGAPSVAATVLRPGDTLARALLRSQLGHAEAAQVVAVLRPGVDARRVRPGERVVVTRTPAGALQSVSYWSSPVEGHEAYLAGEAWALRRVERPVETRVVALGGRLEGSLFESLEGLGETPALVAAVVDLFEWDLDFAADSLPDDRFRLLVEKRYLDGALVGYGDILAAEYHGVDRPVLTAVAFESPAGGLTYYDASGRAVRKMFLRAPLDFTRVTSGYSHARVHPVLGGVRPHLAVDYGAPVGTPVRAVADGVVTHAGWRGGNGLSVTLRHRRGYQTMYNHLSRVDVRPGRRVRQRQVIGAVGSTGLSTGPHLDYRLAKDGRFVNPLDERFQPGDPVPPAHRAAFERAARARSERLAREAPWPAAPPLTS